MSSERDLNKRNDKVIENIKDNYRQLEKSIVDQLHMKHDLHGTTIGSAREDIWRQLFEMIIPKKFVIEQSVFIIDSDGKVSHEVDLAIIDEMYTPYIFRYGRLKFIPIEAVAVVVECKSKAINTESIKVWVESINSLQTAKNSITRLAGSVSFEAVATQQSTRPIKILCTIRTDIVNEIKETFDFIILAERKANTSEEKESKNTIKVLYQDINLLEWFDKLNFHNMEFEEFHKGQGDLPLWRRGLEKITLKNYVISGMPIESNEQNMHTLLSFNFQLNQLLMLINNPILFPHRAYVDMFNRTERENN